MPKPDKIILLETYKTTLAEEQFFNSLFENRLSFYTGLLTTIATAIVLGFFYSSGSYNLYMLLMGPLVLIFVATTGIQAANRASDRMSRILTVRAKIEQALGLTRKYKNTGEPGENYWDNEPIIDVEHLAKRKAYETSSDFSLAMRNRSRGYLAK